MSTDDELTEPESESPPLPDDDGAELDEPEELSAIALGPESRRYLARLVRERRVYRRESRKNGKEAAAWRLKYRGIWNSSQTASDELKELVSALESERDAALTRARAAEVSIARGTGDHGFRVGVETALALKERGVREVRKVAGLLRDHVRLDSTRGLVVEGADREALLGEIVPVFGSGGSTPNALSGATKGNAVAPAILRQSDYEKLSAKEVQALVERARGSK
jgi:hypothetical protein